MIKEKMNGFLHNIQYFSRETVTLREGHVCSKTISETRRIHLSLTMWLQLCSVLLCTFSLIASMFATSLWVIQFSRICVLLVFLINGLHIGILRMGRKERMCR